MDALMGLALFGAGMTAGGGLIVSDCKLNLLVLNENGDPVHPWMTAWMDACSRKFVGWELTLEPNSDMVADSFCRAAVYAKDSDVHGLPRYI